MIFIIGYVLVRMTLSDCSIIVIQLVLLKGGHLEGTRSFMVLMED
jgi:hypothetical protein